MTAEREGREALCDVVVVGAGIAGLSAAWELQRAGLTVRVLEEEPRLGGRIRTIGHGALHAEAGAMVISDQEEETLALARELEIADQLYELGPAKVELFLGERLAQLSRIDGRIRRPSDLVSLLRFHRTAKADSRSSLCRPSFRLLCAQRRVFSAIQRQLRAVEYPYRPDARAAWDEQTFGEFLDAYHPGLRGWFDIQLNVTAGAPSDLISLFWGLIAFDWNEVGSMYIFRHGMSTLPEAIGERLRDRVITGARVEEVRVVGEGVKIACADARGAATLDARFAVVAAPAPVAREIVKGLPTWKSTALERVSYGAYIPVHIRCASRFWEARMESGYICCSDVVFADLYDGTRGQPGDEGVLIGFLAGRSAQSKIGASDEAIARAVLEDVERVFPGTRDQVREVRVFSWPTGTPYFPPRYAETLEALRRPWERIHFCGDYTYGAGINDSVISGQVAARRILGAAR